MTDKELRKLSKSEILELLVSFSEETDRLQQEVAQLQSQIQQKDLELAQAKNCIQNALEVLNRSEIFEKAAKMYLNLHEDEVFLTPQGRKRDYEQPLSE